MSVWGHTGAGSPSSKVACISFLRPLFGTYLMFRFRIFGFRRRRRRLCLHTTTPHVPTRSMEALDRAPDARRRSRSPSPCGPPGSTSAASSAPRPPPRRMRISSPLLTETQAKRPTRLRERGVAVTGVGTLRRGDTHSPERERVAHSRAMSRASSATEPHPAQHSNVPMPSQAAGCARSHVAASSLALAEQSSIAALATIE
jgi:hypothetical protein